MKKKIKTWILIETVLSEEPNVFLWHFQTRKAARDAIPIFRDSVFWRDCPKRYKIIKVET